MLEPLLSVRAVSKAYETHRSAGARFVWQLLGSLSPIKPAFFPAVCDVKGAIELP
ncbi:MAG: hypothetical protein OEU36_14100 [Gammaproteobacteria bacterium]|nr:hypothetical protein [Gammaproteobacteria bacterium]